jgi:hypothetical protein
LPKMKGMAESIMNIADLVREIDECEREIGPINATSALRLGYIPLVFVRGSATNHGPVSGRRGLGRFHRGCAAEFEEGLELRHSCLLQPIHDSLILALPLRVIKR